MDNSLLAVRDINHKYIVVERMLQMNSFNLSKLNQVLFCGGIASLLAI
jgi:hypothetical protein